MKAAQAAVSYGLSRPTHQARWHPSPECSLLAAVHKGNVAADSFPSLSSAVQFLAYFGFGPLSKVGARVQLRAMKDAHRNRLQADKVLANTYTWSTQRGCEGEGRKCRAGDGAKATKPQREEKGVGGGRGSGDMVIRRLLRLCFTGRLRGHGLFDDLADGPLAAALITDSPMLVR